LASRYAIFVSGKRSKWLVLVAWIMIVAVVSPFAAKLGDVENNETETWLPGNAESLVVANLQEEFPNADTVPAVIVYHRDSGLTEADLHKVEADRQAIGAEFPDWQPSPGTPSQDGQAILFTVPVIDFGDENVMDDTKTIRGIVGDGGEGLQVKVTGAAGFATDFVEIFNGIDTTLLLASAAVVAVLLLFTYRSPFVWLVPLLSVAVANQTATVRCCSSPS
jgi:RND superfamily putative drug exporter